MKPQQWWQWWLHAPAHSYLAPVRGTPVRTGQHLHPVQSIPRPELSRSEFSPVWWAPTQGQSHQTAPRTAGLEPHQHRPHPNPGLQGSGPSPWCYHCDPQTPDVRLHVVALLVQLRVYSFRL